MTDITSPEATKFANEYLRPLCESARALKARVNAATNEWYAGKNLLFPNDSSPYVDGRAAEGLTPLTGAAVNSAMGDLITAAAALNDQIIEAPCVRPFVAE